jgi:hypothetical protein
VVDLALPCRVLVLGISCSVGVGLSHKMQEGCEIDVKVSSYGRLVFGGPSPKAWCVILTITVHFHKYQPQDVFHFCFYSGMFLSYFLRADKGAESAEV